MLLLIPEDWLDSLVCAFKDVRAIRDTLNWLAELDCGDNQIFVADAASAALTARAVPDIDARAINSENRGLYSVSNTDYEAAAERSSPVSKTTPGLIATG